MRSSEGVIAGIEHVEGGLHTPFRHAVVPAGVLVGDGEHTADGIVRVPGRIAQVVVTLDEGNDGFRLTCRCAVCLHIIPKLGDDFPVLAADGRFIVQAREELSGFFQIALHGFRLFLHHLFCSAPADDAHTLAAGLGHIEFRGVGGKGMFHEPVTAFVDDHFAARHVLEPEGGAQGVPAFGIAVGQPCVMFVGKVGAPECQIVLTVQTAGECGRQVDPLERKVFDHGNIRSAQHFIVHAEVATGRHNQTPARLVTGFHVFTDTVDLTLNDGAQATFTGLFNTFQTVLCGEVRAFPVVVTEIVIAAFFAESFDPLGFGFRVHQAGIDAAFFCFTDETDKSGAEAVLVLLKNIFKARHGEVLVVFPVGSGDVDPNLVQRIEPVGDQFGGETASDAPDLRQIALIIVNDLFDLFQNIEVLSLPGVVPDHGAEKGIGIGRVDPGSHIDPFGRQFQFGAFCRSGHLGSGSFFCGRFLDISGFFCRSGLLSSSLCHFVFFLTMVSVSGFHTAINYPAFLLLQA